MIAKVAVENTAFSFDDAFDYAIPEKLSKDVRPGVRVLVPFGRGSKKRQGVVFALREKSKRYCEAQKYCGGARPIAAFK